MSKGKYYNYGSMQRDAQRRVYDMQRRAQQAISGGLPTDQRDIDNRRMQRSVSGISYPAAAYPGYRDYYDRLGKTPDIAVGECHDAPKPTPCADPCRDDEPCRNDEPKPCGNMLMDALGRVTNDPEQALLILLLVLLISSGADNELIFVLLYLMM